MRKLAAQHSDDYEQRATAKHFHSGGQKPGSRQLRVTGPE